MLGDKSTEVKLKSKIGTWMYLITSMDLIICCLFVSYMLVVFDYITENSPFSTALK